MQIEFPQYFMRVRESGENRQIWDLIRRKFVTITPEEWVRQHMVRYFAKELQYPLSRIGIEQGIRVAGSLRRTDITVYDPQIKPWMVVECKAAEVKLNQQVLDQVLAYNSAVEAPYLVICNGVEVVILNNKKSQQPEMDRWPEYPFAEKK